MYAIVTKVTTPPRVSRAQFDPRLVISKNRSSRPLTPLVDGSGAGCDVCVSVVEMLFSRGVTRLILR
jgi:hypothetical protein